MFTCAGWCVLDCIENDTETVSEAYDRIDAVARGVLSIWGAKFSEMRTKWINGQCFLIVCHAQNHGSSMHSTVHELVDYISVSASRSYGAISVFDDELLNGPDAYVLKIVGPNVIQNVDEDFATVDSMD